MEANLEESEPEPEETRLINKFKKECSSIVNTATQDYPKVCHLFRFILFLFMFKSIYLFILFSGHYCTGTNSRMQQDTSSDNH